MMKSPLRKRFKHQPTAAGSDDGSGDDDDNFTVRELSYVKDKKDTSDEIHVNIEFDPVSTAFVSAGLVQCTYKSKYWIISTISVINNNKLLLTLSSLFLFGFSFVVFVCHVFFVFPFGISTTLP